VYSAADYVEMLIIIFGECGRNAREAAREFSLIISLTDLLPITKQFSKYLLGLKKQGKFCRIGMKLAEVHEPHGPWLMKRQY
jgi:hypothetical protein